MYVPWYVGEGFASAIPISWLPYLQGLYVEKFDEARSEVIRNQGAYQFSRASRVGATVAIGV